eukprot:5598465-Pleurochrysis_carterae.AAC.1
MQLSRGALLPPALPDPRAAAVRPASKQSLKNRPNGSSLHGVRQTKAYFVRRTKVSVASARASSLGHLRVPSPLRAAEGSCKRPFGSDAPDMGAMLGAALGQPGGATAAAS